MAVTLKKLYKENSSAFKLSLRAGQNGLGNVVSWVYMLEDEFIIPYFHGAELAVTTGMKCAVDSGWLLGLIRRLRENNVAGLVVNTGKFVLNLSQEVVDYCDANDFPIFTMPWEIRITDMLQSFCVQIMNDQQEGVIHDRAMRDAIQKRENVTEYTDTLGRYYDLDGPFTVFCVYLKQQTQAAIEENMNREYLLETRIRRLKQARELSNVHIGILNYESYLLLVLNNAPEPMIRQIKDLILKTYADAAKARQIFIGVGIGVNGLEHIDKSYNRAATAMRMAMYQNTPAVRFEDMGIYKILFSVKDDEILYSYADEILAPLDQYDQKNHAYIDLLKTYIHEDRSLAGTAEALYMHRNTVNYQIQKMKELLNSPLKTVEDLLPFQVALAIRDMQKHSK